MNSDTLSNFYTQNPNEHNKKDIKFSAEYNSRLKTRTNSLSYLVFSQWVGGKTKASLGEELKI